MHRSDEFSAIYNAAWREATNAMKNLDNQRSDGTVGTAVDFSV